MITRTPGVHRITTTTVQPTETLRAMITTCGAADASELGHIAGQETIILRAAVGKAGESKVLIDYTDTDETIRMRREMATINDYLAASELRVDGHPMLPVQLSRRFQIPDLRSPHTFDQHGRLFGTLHGPGAFWINMKNTERHRITLNGEELVDVDFSAMLTNLAYCLAGAPLPTGDPYDGIEGLDLSADPSGNRRDAIKRGLNALYFRTGRMMRLPVEVKELLGADWTAARFIDAVERRHPRIAHLFGTPGLGLRLLATESEIMVRFMLSMNSRGVGVLCVHDGALIPSSKQTLALQGMARASRLVVGRALPAKVTPLPRPSA